MASSMHNEETGGKFQCPIPSGWSFRLPFRAHLRFRLLRFRLLGPRDPAIWRYKSQSPTDTNSKPPDRSQATRFDGGYRLPCLNSGIVSPTGAWDVVLGSDEMSALDISTRPGHLLSYGLSQAASVWRNSCASTALKVESDRITSRLEIAIHVLVSHRPANQRTTTESKNMFCYLASVEGSLKQRVNSTKSRSLPVANTAWPRSRRRSEDFLRFWQPVSSPAVAKWYGHGTWPSKVASIHAPVSWMAKLQIFGQKRSSTTANSMLIMLN